MGRYACRMTLTKKRIFLTLALSLSLSFASAESIVVKVQHKVRLTGIDAPEKAQPFGQRSKQNLSNWVFGKQVSVETAKTDRYGRSLGKVRVGGIDANLEQVKAGYAWHYKKYEREQSVEDRAVYARAEAGARAGRVGLWRDAVQLPPWDWRGCRRRLAGTEAMDCGAFRR